MEHIDIEIFTCKFCDDLEVEDGEILHIMACKPPCTNITKFSKTKLLKMVKNVMNEKEKSMHPKKQTHTKVGKITNDHKPT